MPPALPIAVQRAGERDVVDVVTGRQRERPRLAPARHAAENDLRIALEAHIGAEAQPLHHAGTKAFDHGVSLRDQLQRRLNRFRFLQIEHDGRTAAIGDFPFAGNAPALAIDADHFRAHVGQQHGRKRPRPDAREFDDFDALQRTHDRLRK